MPHRTTHRRIAALVLAALTLASCEPDPASPSPVSSRGTSAANVSPASSASAGNPAGAALGAYRGMWTAFVDASDVADPDAPALARFAAGDALTKLRDGVRDLANKRLVNTGDVRLLGPRVTAVSWSVTPIRVQISDCVDTSGTRLVMKDGSAYDDEPGGRRAMQAQVTQQPDGGWKVTGFGLREVGTC